MKRDTLAFGLCPFSANYENLNYSLLKNNTQDGNGKLNYTTVGKEDEGSKVMM